jgi:uncharacterized protein YdeI (YjbR/CyaY-like superfamily)
MGTRDPRVDDYIGRSAEFARPILERLRDVVHTSCPEVEETIKWSFPHFLHGGGILCYMAAFKEHAAFGFRSASRVVGESASNEAMGQLGRIRRPSDLPPKKLLAGWIREAMTLAAERKKAPKRMAPKAKALRLPADLAAALGKHPKAKEGFDSFPPGAKREYVDWIVEAKREETREKRLATAIEWMSEGKRRNWKYEKC